MTAFNSHADGIGRRAMRRCQLLWFLCTMAVFGLIAGAARTADDPTLQLMHAVASGKTEEIATLVSKGANPNAGINTETGTIAIVSGNDLDVRSALSLSTLCGCPTVTKALLEVGAAPNPEDLFFAIYFNQVEVARTMLARMDHQQGERLPLIAILPMRMPAEISASVRGWLVRQILTGDKSVPDALADWSMALATTYAPNDRDPIFDLLSELLAAGYDLEAPSIGHPAGTAREFSSRNGDILLARVLATKGAGLPSGWTEKREKEIQLVGAARAGNLAGLDMLLGEGVMPNAEDTDGKHALVAACSSRYFDIAQRLLDAGADPDLFAQKEESPMVCAARAAQSSLVASLLAKGAAPDRLDGQGQFSLRAAAHEGATKVVELLLSRGASPQFTDTDGNTALHGMIASSQGAWGSMRDRPIHPSHLETVRTLTAAGLALDSVNHRGETILASNFGRGGDRELVIALLDNGAKATDDDVTQAIRQENANLLRMLLPSTRPRLLSSNLLLEAARAYDRVPDLSIALLEQNIELPEGEFEQNSLLQNLAGGSSEIGLGLTLARGLSLAADPNNEALETAILRGRPRNVALLASKGPNLSGQDRSGQTVLHRVIATDLKGSESLLGEQQQASITALIDAGFVIGTRDRSGRTVVERANAKPATATALNTAIAKAGSTAQGIHRAVRDRDLVKLRRLSTDPVQRESLDNLLRTPLGLALQLHDWTAARILLRAGATISVTPRISWQRSDLDYAGEPAIASAFAVRLLTGTIIDIPADRSHSALLAARSAYADKRSPAIDDFVWNLNCTASRTTCGNGIPMQGNTSRLSDLIESVRSDKALETEFGLVQRNLGSIHPSTDIDLGSLGGPSHLDFGEITFLITGKTSINGCTFSFDAPACSPGVKIRNPNEPTGLSMATDMGFEQLPTATLRYVQAQGASGVVGPGEEIVLDRSIGPITVEMEQVRARVFSLWIEITRFAGEDVTPLSVEPSTRNRMDHYARILRLLQQRKDQPANDAERATNKTIASTISALSNEAYLSNYPAVVLELLRQQARVVANLDLQVRQIQNAVMAQATYTPQQIDVLIVQIDRVLANPNTGDRPSLLAIRAELVALRASAEASGVAVNALRNTLFTDADLLIELYQALVLEYRQYVPSSDLASALSNEERTAILQRVDGRDVVIVDGTDGTGKITRQAFGLPDPTR